MEDSTWEIKKKLERMKIKSPAGKNIWRVNTVASVLTNEKFKGDALLQKYYTVDFLTKKKAVNKGEVPQYYIKDDHEPIISKEMFKTVQNKLVERFDKMNKYSGINIITRELVCGNCGGSMRRVVVRSVDKYRGHRYRCFIDMNVQENH